MRNKSLIFLLLIFLPLVGGVLASFAAQSIWNPVPILLFKIDVGMVAFIAGTFFTLFLLMFWLGAAGNERQANKLIEESLRDSEQGRQRFLRRLDHEIKNPLTGLRAALVNLQESGDSTERQRASENAGRAVERLTRLLTDLRKLSDLEERAIE
ncbi:MAG TPA: histidine kinase dimerization/phospho-acceptor domain-containing protein, partial [Anaerolineales bacterium]|nr:histidine kinase dimerization/phospho-acceptor domain-containing protein [Anaerolineales bacterium]